MDKLAWVSRVIFFIAASFLPHFKVLSRNIHYKTLIPGLTDSIPITAI